MNSIRFDTLNQAIEYAKRKGGWIYASECGSINKWYDATKWTITPILKDNAGTSGLVATWPEHAERV